MTHRFTGTTGRMSNNEVVKEDTKANERTNKQTERASERADEQTSKRMADESTCRRMKQRTSVQMTEASTRMLEYSYVSIIVCNYSFIEMKKRLRRQRQRVQCVSAHARAVGREAFFFNFLFFFSLTFFCCFFPHIIFHSEIQQGCQDMKSMLSE
ncbi:unnamed protein product [Ceratitis capitata]|uniref:(Mediterranean fruit fly) hypothetical protein n=1 Tax=Ceratitis capitata TaxID=7213 RepID=A0A811V5T9_CERCA|nr:unnamed protein product [Ceratitis capitata]